MCHISFSEDRQWKRIRASKFGCFDKSGRAAFDTVFDEVNDFFQGLACVRLNGKWGYIDLSGRIVVSPQFQDARNFNEGLAAVKKDGLWGFIDTGNRWIVTPKFSDAMSFHEGYAAVSALNKVGYIDKTGRVAVLPRYESGCSFSQGLARVEKSHPEKKLRNDVYYIDCHDHVVINEADISSADNYPGIFLSQGTYELRPPKPFCDRGSELGEQARDSLVDFAEGLLPVSFGGKFGYIDRKGRVAIPAKYDRVASFREGLAVVFTVETPHSNGEKGYRFITKSGQNAFNKSFWRARNFHEGIAFVQCSNGDNGYINKNGELIINLGQREGDDFSDGLANVGNPTEYL